MQHLTPTVGWRLFATVAEAEAHHVPEDMAEAEAEARSAVTSSGAVAHSGTSAASSMTTAMTGGTTGIGTTAETAAAVMTGNRAATGEQAATGGQAETGIANGAAVEAVAVAAAETAIVTPVGRQAKAIIGPNKDLAATASPRVAEHRAHLNRTTHEGRPL